MTRLRNLIPATEAAAAIACPRQVHGSRIGGEPTMAPGGHSLGSLLEEQANPLCRQSPATVFGTVKVPELMAVPTRVVRAIFPVTAPVKY